MEIIFDSIEERDTFFDLFCAEDGGRWKRFGADRGVDDRDCNPGNCRKCWENSGLKYRIKPDKNGMCGGIHLMGKHLKPRHNVIDLDISQMMPWMNVESLCPKTVHVATNWDVNPVLKQRAKEILNEMYGSKVFIIPVSKPISSKEERVTKAIKELNNAIAELYGVPESVLTGVKEEPQKSCQECKHEDVHEFEEPCGSCEGENNFEKKEDGKTCKNCQNKHVHIDDEPCCNCGFPEHSKFEDEKEIVKSCSNCKHNHITSLKEPCKSCVAHNICVITYSKWEPKDAK